MTREEWAAIYDRAVSEEGNDLYIGDVICYAVAQFLTNAGGMIHPPEEDGDIPWNADGNPLVLVVNPAESELTTVRRHHIAHDLSYHGQTA